MKVAAPGDPVKKSKKAPKASEWQFVEDEEFQNNVAAAGASKRTRAPSAMICACGLISLLIVGVYIVELEEMAEVRDHVLARYKNTKPFWQTNDEIIERLSADGQAYTEHKQQDEAQAAAEGAPAVITMEVPEKPLAEPHPNPEADPAPEPASVVDEAGSSVEGEGRSVTDGSAFEELRSWKFKEVGAAPEKGEEEEAPPAAAAQEEEASASAEGPVGYTARGVWPPPHCNLRQPVKAGPLLAKGKGKRLLRRLLGEAPTQLLVKKQPPDEALKQEVYEYIMDFYASNTSCLPRAMKGKSRDCSGSGGGNSCRGMEGGYCQAAPAWREGKAMDTVAMWKTYRSPHGVEERGSWGSCAFVATGEQVLKGEFGPDIDSHDTVMRYNTPIKGFEKHVGVKTALLWSKTKYTGANVPTKGYIMSKIAGQSPLYTPAMSNLRTFRDQVYRMWFQARDIKEGKAAAGFARAVALVKSGLCKSVSLYGFHTQPGKGGGKYFDQKAVVTKGHTIDWDGWLLKAMMDLGYLCVYGE